MPLRTSFLKRPAVVLFVAFHLLLGVTWAQTETVLYSFRDAIGIADGNTPTAPLIFDAKGNLYGTTEHSDPSDTGTVFQLTPGANNTCTETLLYTFTGSPDGSNPDAGLI